MAGQERVSVVAGRLVGGHHLCRALRRRHTARRHSRLLVEALRLLGDLVRVRVGVRVGLGLGLELGLGLGLGLG